MAVIDYAIFIIYFFLVLFIGFYFYRKNKSKEDYFVGGRNLGSGHVGMSIVATDVGGGFSIGLGGLGYLMGFSGSWLLFTGLVGAWLSAVLLVPKVKKLGTKNNSFTFPDFLRSKYNKKVAFAAAIISGIGYMGFTGGQVLAGAKLASATLFHDISFVQNPMLFSTIIIGTIVIIYTVLGGIKAVIYTDTIQWIILLSGLIFLAIPFSIIKSGGWAQIRNSLPPEYFTLSNVSFIQLLNWAVTIIPIWFIAMTLYQRIYAVKSEKEAKKAFLVAGILEYPVMAFMGVILGMISKIHFANVDAEMGLPMLLEQVLPIGITGIVIASYFSAIMSTADSCLMASSGNIVNDILEKTFFKSKPDKFILKLSQLATLFIGITAIIIATSFVTVLEIILHAYSFMIAGLFYPTIRTLFVQDNNSNAALAAILGGGSFTLVLIFTGLTPWGIAPGFFGILISILFYHLVHHFLFKKKKYVRQNRNIQTITGSSW